MIPKFSPEEVAATIRGVSASRNVTKCISDEGLMDCAQKSCKAMEQAPVKGPSLP